MNDLDGGWATSEKSGEEKSYHNEIMKISKLPEGLTVWWVGVEGKAVGLISGVANSKSDSHYEHRANRRIKTGN